MLSGSQRVASGVAGRICGTLKCPAAVAFAVRRASTADFTKSTAAASAAASTNTSGTPLSHSTISNSNSSIAPGARTAVEQMYTRTQKKRDPFLREGTATSRFFRAYRTQLPFPARMFGIFLLGFTLGMIIEVFACKTHLYESVMMKKDARRHEFDEFVVDFRQNVERWQREDMSKRQTN